RDCSDCSTRSSAGEIPACSASCSGLSAQTAAAGGCGAAAAPGAASSAQALAPSNRPGATPTARTTTTPPMATAISGRRRGILLMTGTRKGGKGRGSGREQVFVETAPGAVEALLRRLVSGHGAEDGGHIGAARRAAPRGGGQSLDAFGQSGHADGAFILCRVRGDGGRRGLDRLGN